MANCNCIHLVTTVTTSATEFTLNFSAPPAVVNSEPFNFKIPCYIGSVPNSSLPVTINVSVNGTTVAVPLLNRFGNQVYSMELRNKVVYKGYFGSVTTNHIIALNTPRAD